MSVMMATGFDLRLPRPLDCSNLAKQWPRWKQDFGIYLRANNKMNENESNKIATFLWLIGARGVKIFNTLYPNDGNIDNLFGHDNEGVENAEGGGDADDRFVDANDGSAARTLAEVIKAFDEYCLPRKNIAMEAFKFNLIAQQEKQSFGDFETELRTQVQYCEFKCAACHVSYAERMLRDRIIIGVQDKKLQLKLLDDRDDPLSKVIETSKVFGAASENRLLLDRKAHPLEVNAVEEQSKTTEVAAVSRPSCYNCGKPFHRRSCPAVNAECHSCGEVGHFKKCCRKKPKDRRNFRTRRHSGGIWNEVSG
ncbi:uncharacterized protein LOC131692858 [Topomyia yanbarensis]|uniref:uncharacterized protein LOC131692857 n=1 Tax=Topomyia yanbarensis TaxID=2498891 RepID=UPI00273B8663|nr:uncharacterized protein LOC131692857 [Topomyia yanbarensis]XP_058836177.1 uncharacterized protein LOC131692858 [Topomyia yanbarensis]